MLRFYVDISQRTDHAIATGHCPKNASLRNNSEEKELYEPTAPFLLQESARHRDIKPTRFTQEQFIGILREQEAGVVEKATLISNASDIGLFTADNSNDQTQSVLTGSQHALQ